MISLWSIMSWVLFPLSMIMMIILMVPIPLSLEIYRIKFIDRLVSIKTPLNFPLFPGIKLFIIVLIISGVVCVYEFLNLQYRPSSYLKGDPCSKAGRWRAERNFWISVVTFVMYFMTWKYHQLKSAFHLLQKETKST